jgi:hypothetical protein
MCGRPVVMNVVGHIFSRDYQVHSGKDKVHPVIGLDGPEEE